MKLEREPDSDEIEEMEEEVEEYACRYGYR